MSDFSRSLIGGDIDGLAALAATLNGYPPRVTKVVDALDHQVENLVHDAGWWGDAANSFRTRWEVDANGAHALARLFTVVGGVIDGLAEILRQIEVGLEQYISDARAAGVPVGPDGQPPVLPPSAEPEVLAAAATYALQWQVAHEMASRARMDANRRLVEIDSSIALRKDTDHPTPFDWETDADYLRGFLASTKLGGKYLGRRIPNLQAKREEAHAKFTAANKEYSKLGVKTPDYIKDERRATLKAFEKVNADMARLERVEENMPLFKTLDVRVGSAVVKLAPELATDSRMFRGLAAMPVIDLVFVAAGTVLQSIDDNQKGEDWSSAVPKDLTANVVGLASGVLIGAAVVAGVAALGISAPAVVVGIAAVAIGGAVAIGVGDAVSEAFHEHWDEDIHKYGLVSGIGSGLANVGTNTVKDMADLGGKTKDAVGGGISSLWHGIFH